MEENMARIAGSDSVKTKSLIVEAALRLIAQGGFEALTMRALSAAVGLQVGALYYHFKDKQALLVYLLDRHFDRLLAEYSLLKQAASPVDRLVQFSTFHIKYHANDRLSAGLAAREMRSLDRDNAAILLKKRGNYERELRVILQDGVGDGAFRIDDIGLTTTGILALLTEISIWFRPGGKQTLDEMAASQTAMILKMVAA
jgi:AcrR family transcriptional regulator